MERCVVFLPTYNGESFISQTLDSIFLQSYDNYTVAIIDDGSQDRTIEIIEQYVNKYPGKITFSCNDYNLGVGQTLHKMFSKYQNLGTYLAMIGQDDIWDKNYLSEQITALKNKDGLVSFGKVNYIDDFSKKISRDIFRHEIIDKLDNKDFYIQMLSGCFLCAPSSVINLEKVDRNEFSAFWGYNNDRLQDYELWMRLILMGKILYTPKAICNYRQHTNNFSDNQKRITQGRLEFYSTLRRSLFSNEFLIFLKNLPNEEEQEHFLVRIVNALVNLVGYSSLLKILIIDFCEYLFTKGYYYESLDKTLRYYYEDFGVFSKAVKNEDLPIKIQAVVWGYIYDENIKYLRDNSKYFNVVTDLEATNYTNIVFIQADYIDHYINFTKLFDNFKRNQVIIFSKGDQQFSSTQKKYPNTLIIPDSCSKNKLDKIILSYIEDKTALMHYNSPIPNRLDYLYTEKVETTRVMITGDFTFVRRVRFVDSVVKAADFRIDGDLVENVINENNDWLFQDNQFGGELSITLEHPLALSNRIVVNNELYVANSIVFDNNEYVFVYKKLCFYNSNAYILPGVVAYYDMVSASNEYHNIVNSKGFKYFIKIRDFVNRSSIFRKIFELFDKVTRRVYKNSRIFRNK
jgi:glycosyltransferase involved in cell wall biosynthesis